MDERSKNEIKWDDLKNILKVIYMNLKEDQNF